MQYFVLETIGHVREDNILFVTEIIDRSIAYDSNTFFARKLRVGEHGYKMSLIVLPLRIVNVRKRIENCKTELRMSQL